MTEEDDSSSINVRLPDQQDYSTPGRGSSVSASQVQSDKTEVSSLDEAKTQQNAAILKASLEVSIQSKNQPLALLLKSAITGINELLKPQFGDNAIQAAASEDNTPTGTADRIVSLSTGFYDLFKQQHPGEDPNDVLTNFMAIIRSGFETGFKEAQGILNGMGVLNGDIASDIDKTRELVQKGYADFESAMRQSLSGTNNASQATSA
ncbi:MAG: DUF5610 domain-containing protein [Sulfuricella sp.]